jgi:hypothetical protein
MATLLMHLTPEQSRSAADLMKEAAEADNPTVRKLLEEHAAQLITWAEDVSQ